MKAPLFHAGQAITPITTNWTWAADCEGIVPKMGAVYIVTRLDSPYMGSHYIVLDAFPQDTCFDEECFAPIELASDEAIAELLQEAFTPVHV